MTNLSTSLNLNTTSQQTIRELKEKLHKSFLELSDMEKLYEDQIAAQRLEYQAKILQLQTKNKALVQKLKLLQARPQSKDQDLGLSFEQSIIESGKKQSTSFIQQQSFLDLINKNPRQRKSMVTEFEKIVRNGHTTIPIQLEEHFKIVYKLQEENQSFQEEIKNLNNIIYCQKQKVDQLLVKNFHCKNSEERIKHQRDKITEMYKRQFEKMQILQAKLKDSHQQISTSTVIKSLTNENVRCNNSQREKRSLMKQNKSPLSKLFEHKLRTTTQNS